MVSGTRSTLFTVLNLWVPEATTESSTLTSHLALPGKWKFSYLNVASVHEAYTNA